MNAFLSQSAYFGALLTVLADYPGDENVFQTAMSLLRSRRDRVAVLADCLRDRLEAVYPDGWPEGTFDESAEYCYNGITREWN